MSRASITRTVDGVYLLVLEHEVSCLVGYPRAPPGQRHLLTGKFQEFRTEGNQVNAFAPSI